MNRINLSNTWIVSGIILALLFFYVYQRVQIFRTGYKIRNIEKEIKKYKRDNSFLEIKISTLLNPGRIAGEVKRLGLNLAPPGKKQIITIKQAAR